MIRIAVASTPLAATLKEAVPATIAAIEEAGRLGAGIVCLPETGLPGHRVQARRVPDVPQDALDEALDNVAAAARRAHVTSTSHVASAGCQAPRTRSVEPSRQAHGHATLSRNSNPRSSVPRSGLRVGYIGQLFA